MPEASQPGKAKVVVEGEKADAPATRTTTTSGSPPPPVPGQPVRPTTRTRAVETTHPIEGSDRPEGLQEATPPEELLGATGEEPAPKKKGKVEARYKVQHTQVGNWTQGQVITPDDLKDQDVQRLVNLGAISPME